MHPAIERVEQIRRAGLHARLMKGARAIGEIRRLGVFCSGEWSRNCPCDPRSDFCDAKALWIELVEDLHEGPPWSLSGDEPFYLAEAMTCSQWLATGLTMRILDPSRRHEIRVGPGGTDWATVKMLAEAYGGQDYPELLESVAKIQKVLR